MGAVSPSSSCALAAILSVVVFTGMQTFRIQLASSREMTILGGFIGSELFVFLLTAISNFEMSLFGKNFAAGIFPEVIVSLVIAMVASGLVHRVCVTTCFIFSMIALYFLNRISTATYNKSAPPTPVKSSKSKRK